MTQQEQKYEFQDVQEPVLYREMFPYDELPRVIFEDATVAPPRRIALVMYLTRETFELLEGETLAEFLAS